MHTSLVVNLFAPPGTGKSTTAAGLFFRLKNLGINAELAGEYAKDLVWSGRHRTLEDQLYVFGKQHHRIHRLSKDVDVIIADSPILMGLAYGQDYPKCYHDTVHWAFNQYDNINFFLNRTKPYNPKGRNQTESESYEKGVEIRYILDRYDVVYSITTGDEEGLKCITDKVMQKLSK